MSENTTAKKTGVDKLIDGIEKVCNKLQPSILAASSKSFGKPRKYWRIKNIPNPPNSAGKIRAW